MTVLIDPGGAADNLLLDCAGLQAGQSLLIVQEDPGLGWYDAELGALVARAAAAIGIAHRTLAVGAPKNARDGALAAAMARHECTLFLSRIGDQERFAPPASGNRVVMCYVRTPAMLHSPFGQVPYRATREMKETLDALMARARRIDITCPLGTRCTYVPVSRGRREAADVSVRRFPLGVVAPVSAMGVSGRVALARFLTPTGSRVYDPAWLPLDEPVFARVEAGRIVAFEGHAATVAKVERHYAGVAARFGIDPNAVHSWHAGTHPGLSYDRAAALDPDRWSNTVFNHPRVLHFHTCGGYAPGEICWNVTDPSIHLDGKPLWREGALQVGAFRETRRCLEDWPELEALYGNPSDRVGL